MFLSFRLAEFFERYREFISTLAFRLSTMQLPVASWSAHERQRFYSVVAAVLAQYIDIMVCGISLASVDFVSAQVCAIRFMHLQPFCLRTLLFQKSTVVRKAYRRQ